MRGLTKRLLGPMLIVLLWSGISPCYSQSLGESDFVLPSDELLDECLGSPCGEIIRPLVEQNEKDMATIRLLKIDLLHTQRADSLEASYWREMYEDERGNVIERAVRYYGPALMFILGVWAGSSAAN